VVKVAAICRLKVERRRIAPSIHKAGSGNRQARDGRDERAGARSGARGAERERSDKAQPHHSEDERCHAQTVRACEGS